MLAEPLGLMDGEDLTFSTNAADGTESTFDEALPAGGLGFARWLCSCVTALLTAVGLAG